MLSYLSVLPKQQSDFSNSFLTYHGVFVGRTTQYIPTRDVLL